MHARGIYLAGAFFALAQSRWAALMDLMSERFMFQTQLSARLRQHRLLQTPRISPAAMFAVLEPK
jgi:hypothetical protein